MSSVLLDEVTKFDALAMQWWDPHGPMRVLHQMNTLRVGWIDARLRAAGLGGARLLDVGCGAGLAAESLALMGYDVTGIDAAAGPVAAAVAHAPAGLGLAYRVGELADLVAERQRFGALTALEVIEHVADPVSFVASIAAVLAPGGMAFISTLNRTAASYVVAKLGAEYALRLLPVGTHAWERFVSPATLATSIRAAGLRMSAISGMRPGLSGWRLTPMLAVNYIVCATAGQ